MKKILRILLSLFVVINAHAINVRVFFSNNTADALRPVAEVRFIKEGVLYENVAIEPVIPVIEPYAQQVKIDRDRVGIENYFMVWFELNDQYNHYKMACLDSYVPVFYRSADIYFTLTPDEEDPGLMICRHKVIFR